MLEKIKNKTYNFLRWSEKYTKTDMLYLVKSGSWLTIGQIVSSTSAFLLAIAFANLLPKETYGTYKYILSLVGILNIFTLSGINTSITQAVARNYDGSLISGLKTKIHWGLWGGLASLVLSSYYYFQGNITLAISFLIVAFFLPFMDSFSVYGDFLQGKKKFDSFTKFFIISQLVSVSLMIIVLFLTKNLFLILLAYFTPWTLMRYIFLKITIKKFVQNDTEDPKTTSYGKHLSVMGIIGTASNYLDRLLVFHYFGAIELAVYSFAIAIPEQIKGFLKNINVLALPKFSERSKEEIKKEMLKKVSLLTGVVLVIVIIYILTAPFIFKIFFPQYMDSVLYSQVFAISLIAVISALPHSALKAKMAQRELYLRNIFESVVQITSLFILLYFFGLWGIIWSRVITRLLSTGFSLLLIRRI